MRLCIDGTTSPSQTLPTGSSAPANRPEDRKLTTARWSVAKLLRLLGPGLLTGAADDDPSGIATYSQSGAQFGYALCWVMLLATPFMVAIQIVSARIGSVTGRGLAANLSKVLPPVALGGLVVLVVAANIFNIVADFAAMAAAVGLLVGGPAPVYALGFGVLCLTAEILISYRTYAKFLKVLTFVLFAYVATAFSIRVPWGQVAAATLIPHISWSRDQILMLVAVLGTTISPYLFFWQASLEVEERRIKQNKKEATLKINNRLAKQRFQPIVIDTWAGMALSNIIGFFIIVATAATLHAHGTSTIGTAADAAEALRPLAGPFAFLLFSVGIIGTGLLAIPALAGSAAYAIAETFGWKNSLGLPPTRARGFYFIVGGSTLLGAIGAMTRLDPIRMLVWSAVLNGIVAVPLMVMMMLLITNSRIMGNFIASRMLAIFGWLATLLMSAAVTVFFLSSITD
ncbi:MAG: divalent metal cation transporter [Hyphomicrobiales bacterium]|nr:divalent metal cation transporter [Hyphomicrobiales bacterium]MDE2285827.1 divalent metal cation transporter [Hyphomicrobiales bacterium]